MTSGFDLARAVRFAGLLGATLLAAAAPARADLSAGTREALERFRAGDPDAYEAVAVAPEYEEVAALMVEVLRESDHGLHNNACLALEGLVAAHRGLALPPGPILDCLAHRRFTCQQKAAQVVRDALAANPAWLKGREEEAARRLIPLTASQRSRVYRAALACLEPLTGQRIGRDPLRWAAWFKLRYRRALGLDGAVYEIVAVIDASGAGRTLDGKAVKGDAELRREFDALRAKAEDLGLDLATVVVVPTDVLASGDIARIQATVGGLQQALGLSELTVAPPEDEFRPPVAELLPKKKRASFAR